MTNLARKATMDRTTCSRNLRVLAEKSLVRFEESDDKRMKKAVLTRQGQQAVEKALPLWEKAQNYVLDKFGEKRMNNLLNDLSRIVKVARMS
jgi:DNA-binding MarR family transcriptional regulator